MGEAMMLEGAADTLAFEVYIKEVLAPSLSAGQIVVMDNLSIHTGPLFHRGHVLVKCSKKETRIMSSVHNPGQSQPSGFFEPYHKG
jgi:hypothetical protein